MKTLSLLQPWATLVVIGAKKFETRSWATKYRGPLLIHASKKWGGEQELVCIQAAFFKALHNAKPSARVTGSILGRVDLVDCVPTEDWLTGRLRDFGRVNFLVRSGLDGDQFLTSEDYREYAFGNYGPGRFAWKLENPIAFGEPIPAKGSLGIWEFPESALGHLAEKTEVL